MKMTIPAAVAAVIALSTDAQAQNCDRPMTTPAGVIEIVQSRLAETVSREAFVAAAARTMPALCAMDGFLGRVLSEGEGGLWMDHVRWTTAEAAQAVMAGSMENETLRPFIMSIDPNSMVISYQVPVLFK